MKVRQGSKPGRIVIGGPVDLTTVTLCVYGHDLDPSEVSLLLGCEPTRAHRRGDRRPTKSPSFPDGFAPPRKQGAWFLTEEVASPKGPEEATRHLLEHLPDDEAWADLGNRYDVRLSYMITVTEWNRGFDLSKELVARIAGLNVSLLFDIYAEDDDEAEQG